MKTIFYINRGRIETRIEGRRAYPDRRWERTHPLPKDGEEWEIRVAGENPAKTVYFLMPVRLISSAEQREAARLAENRAAIRAEIARVVGEDWQEINEYLEGGRIEVRTNENLGSTGFSLRLDHGGFYDLMYYPREGKSVEEYTANLQTMINASRSTSLEQARRVAYWDERISELPKCEFNKRAIMATGYKVHVSYDCDWGLHEADDGYTITVYPIVDGVGLLDWDAAYKEAVKVACDELRYYRDPFTAAEEDDHKAVYVLEYARRVVAPWMFEKVTVSLTEEQIREIDREYRDRDFGFETSWVFYVKVEGRLSGTSRSSELADLPEGER